MPESVGVFGEVGEEVVGGVVSELHASVVWIGGIAVVGGSEDLRELEPGWVDLVETKGSISMEGP